MAISPTSKQTAAAFASTLKQLNDEANQTASIGANDSRFKTLSDDLDQMISQTSDADTKSALQSMKNDLANLQALAGSTDQHTDVTNSSWQMLTKNIDDLAAETFGTTDPLGVSQIPNSNKYLNGVQGGGVGTAYQYLSDTQAKAAGLPTAVALAQKTQQVNKIADAKPPVYVTSSNTSPVTYDVYDASGNKLNDKPLQNFALGLNNGKWLKINQGGIARSVAITSDQLKTLPSNTELYDLNGMTNNKLVARGANVGGSAASSNGGNTPRTPSTPNAATIPGGSIAGANKGPGPGTAYYNMSASATPLPGALAKKQQTQQVNYLADANPPVYITSDNTKPTLYELYDSKGRIMQAGLTPPFAIGMNNGSWYAGSPDGVGKAWTTTDPSSLDPKTKLWDLNGAATQLADRGFVGGANAPNNAGTTPPAGGGAANIPGGSIAGANKGPGPGTAYYNMDASATPLPGKLPGIQAKQQVNYLADANPPVYVTSSNTQPILYDVYDNGGQLMQTGLTPPFALGMNNGSWYAGSPDGVGKAWTTTNPSSLDPKTKLWDLNGAPYGKLADKGSVGGTSSQSSNPNAATFVAGHSNKDNSSDSPQMSTAPRNGGTRYAYSAGAKSSAGTTKAEVWSATQDGSGNQHWVKLTDENGNEITPPDGDNSLNRGQYGTFTYTNGSEYISMDPSKLTGVRGSSGYWTVTGDTATDIVTGQTMKAADLQAVVKAQNLHNWTQAQSTQAIKNRDNPQDSGTEDSPVFDPINY